MQASPYEARFLLEEITGHYGEELTPFEKVGYGKHQKGTVSKCTFCSERVAKGLQPACVQTCPALARTFGDLDDPDSNVSRLIRERSSMQLRPELGTNPSVYYLL